MISKQEIMYVANLARLNIDGTQIDKFSNQISQVLEYIDTLNQLDTTNISPTTHAIFLTNAFRDDMPGEHLGVENALYNAPQKEDGNFTVPKVIG